MSGAGGTVTYNIYSLNPHQWGWNNVASGGTVTVTNGVVPPSNPVTLDPGVYAWKASYSGDTTNAPSKNHRGSGIEIVLRPGSSCPTGDGWMSVRCFHDNNGNGGGNGNQGNGGEDNHGGNSTGTVAGTTTTVGTPTGTVAGTTTRATVAGTATGGNGGGNGNWGNGGNERPLSMVGLTGRTGH